MNFIFDSTLSVKICPKFTTEDAKITFDFALVGFCVKNDQNVKLFR